MNTKKILLFVVNDIGFFLSHRLPIALAARESGFDVHIAAPDGKKSAALDAFGFVHHSWALTRSSINPFKEIASFFKLLQILRHLKPDILHLITMKPMFYGGIAARLVGVHSVVAAVTGLGFIFSGRGFRVRLLRFFVACLYRVALKHSSLCVIFQNCDDMEIISRLASLEPGKRCLIRGAGVDLEKFAPSQPFFDPPVIVLAARLLKSKGVPEFVAAARRLRAQGIKGRFVLVGMPDAENPVAISEDFIAASVAEGVIEHWGHREDMPEVLAQSALVVLPSWRGEGVPKVLLEAAAAGRAVVTTDVPGCRDAIIPGVTGLLVPLRDAGALADAIEQLLNDPERLQTMGKAGRELAEREFDVRGVVEKHLEIYRQLLLEEKMP